MEEFKKNPSVKVMTSPYPNRKMRHMKIKHTVSEVKYIQTVMSEPEYVVISIVTNNEGKVLSRKYKKNLNSKPLKHIAHY